MGKQVFEFTDLEVMQILADKLVADGKVKAGKCHAWIESQGKGWGEEGFIIRVKIGEEKL